MLIMTRDDYRDRVYGGWLGKNAGSTLGAPQEGKRDVQSLQFYDPIPGQSIANDGLDFQLLWLNALRENPDLTSDDLAALREAHITYPWDEYGWAANALRQGFGPPLSGSFNNWFKRGIRAVSRCDIWGMISPGSPQEAASRAYADSVVDHADEGIWAPIFWAAMESAAFFVRDCASLVDCGLAMIPENCLTARAARISRDCWTSTQPLMEARSRILAAVGQDNYTNAPQNIGFATLGLLYGNGDFGASISVTAGMGYAAQTNTGAVGALLGITLGRSGLPPRWIDPIGDAVVIGFGLVDLAVERTVAELVEHTVEITDRILGPMDGKVQLVDRIEKPVVAEAIAAPPPPEPEPVVIPDQPVPLESAEPAESVPASEVPTIPDVAAAMAESAPVAEETPPPSDVTAGDGETPAEEAAVPSSTTYVPPVPTPVAPPEPAMNWRENGHVIPLWTAPPNAAVMRASGFEVTVDYGPTGPSMILNRATTITLQVRNVSDGDFVGHVNLNAPAGWQVGVPGAQGQRQMLAKGGMARFGFVLRAPDSVTLWAKNPVTFVLTPEKAAATTFEIPFVAGSCWTFVGPFKNMDGEGFDLVYGPEDKPGYEETYLGRDGSIIRWQRLAFTESVMDIESLFSGQPGVAYGVTNLHVASPTEARIVAHCNDGVKVSLNREKILRRHSHEAFRPTLGYGPSASDVTLKAGDNQIVVKIVRCSDPIQFSLEVTDREGKLIPDLGNNSW